MRKIRKERSVPLANCFSVLLRVEVVPHFAFWQDVLDPLTLHFAEELIGLDEFRRYQDRAAKHELSLYTVKVFYVWEVVPHAAQDWLCIVSGLLKGCVDVVDEVVSAINRVFNHSLDSLCLRPRLSSLVIDVTVGPEEGIVHAQLVEQYPEVFRWITEESRHVSSTKWDSCVAKLENHR